VSGVLRVGEASKASPPAWVSFAGLQRPPGPFLVAAQRCMSVDLPDAGGLYAPWPLPLVLKSRVFIAAQLLRLQPAQGRPSEGKRSAVAGRAQRGLDLFLGQNRTDRGDGDAEAL
jgi:hypothetical protein